MRLSRSAALISGFVWLIAVCCGAAFVYTYAYRLGLHDRFPLNFWMTFVAIQFLIIPVHELGHALGTWAVGYRLKVISVGPVAIVRDGRGNRRWRFNWRAIWLSGFIGAIPNSGSRSGLRANAMLIVFAGPFVTLICAAVLFLILINLPGTGMEIWWEPVALAVVLFNASFFQNMTPVGIVDGNRLLQMALRNRAGEEFLKLFASASDVERAEESRENFELDEEIASRMRVVEQTLAARSKDHLPLANAYLNLGMAQFQAVEMEDAEANLSAALELFEQCPDVHPVHQGNTWLLLCHVHHHFQRADRMQIAYTHAISALARAKKKDGAYPLQNRLAVANLHLQTGHPDLARDEIEAGLAKMNSTKKLALNRAILFRLLAECDFALGCPDRGLAAAREAAAVLRSPAVMDIERKAAARELAGLGMALWTAGQDEEGIQVTLETVEWLEKNDEPGLAARVRISLTDMLRRQGRLSDAESALPAEANLPPNKWDVLCTVRGRIRLSQSRFEEAVNDFERVIQLKETNRPEQIELALNLNDLAEAMFGCERVADAECHAQEALEILLPSGHPVASGVLITLALIGWQRGEPGANQRFEEGIQCVVNAPLLKPATKARALKEEGRRLRYYGHVNEAARAEDEAQKQWLLAGVEQSVSKPSCPVEVLE
jgi:tetratricopeptide (TPR) repeat protein